MEKAVAAFWELVGRPAVDDSDREIKVGRIALTVLPAVSSDRPERLFMEIPQDLRPVEAIAPMALKAALVGMENLPGFLARLKSSLHAGLEHRERCGPWTVTCSEKGSLLSIEARYQP